MRKIISGKAYDTKTATRIASWDNGYFANDFQHCEEVLFRTPRGGWFLYGHGGAMSKYSKSYGNDRGGSEQIEPFTPEQARKWLEEHDCTKALEYHFGQVEDAADDAGYDFKLRGIPAGTHEKIKAEAEKTGRSMNELMINLIIANFK